MNDLTWHRQRRESYFRKVAETPVHIIFRSMSAEQMRVALIYLSATASNEQINAAFDAAGECS